MKCFTNADTVDDIKGRLYRSNHYTSYDVVVAIAKWISAAFVLAEGLQRGCPVVPNRPDQPFERIQDGQSNMSRGRWLTAMMVTNIGYSGRWYTIKYKYLVRTSICCEHATYGMDWCLAAVLAVKRSN